MTAILLDISGGKQITQLASLMRRARFQENTTSPKEHSTVELIQKVNMTSQATLHASIRENGVYVGTWEVRLLLKKKKILIKKLVY